VDNRELGGSFSWGEVARGRRLKSGHRDKIFQGGKQREGQRVLWFIIRRRSCQRSLTKPQRDNCSSVRKTNSANGGAGEGEKRGKKKRSSRNGNVSLGNQRHLIKREKWIRDWGNPSHSIRIRGRSLVSLITNEKNNEQGGQVRTTSLFVEKGRYRVRDPQ